MILFIKILLPCGGTAKISYKNKLAAQDKSMCMISVGKIKETRENSYLVDVDGKNTLFPSELELKPGDFVMLSGNRIVKKLKVVR